jgi:hypothetical protein
MEAWIKPDFEEVAVNSECTAYANQSEPAQPSHTAVRPQ